MDNVMKAGTEVWAFLSHTGFSGFIPTKVIVEGFVGSMYLLEHNGRRRKVNQEWVFLTKEECFAEGLEFLQGEASLAKAEYDSAQGDVERLLVWRDEQKEVPSAG